jgi:predicted branched-subunit amino acid permease
MNIVLRVYLIAGLAFILSVYVISLSLWFDATLNGVVNGQYTVAIDTNALGEDFVALSLFFIFLPAATWMFTRGLRRIIRSEAPI